MSNRPRPTNPPRPGVEVRVVGVVEADTDRTLFRGVRVADGAPVTFHVLGEGAHSITEALTGEAEVIVHL